MSGNFGFIREKLEIKILILFILRRLPEAIPFDMLMELTMCDEGVSYFDFTQCVSELLKTGHIREADGMYALTIKGAHNTATTQNSLPYSVREIAEKATSKLRSKMTRDGMISTSREADGDTGFAAIMSMSDGIGDIISIKLFAPSEESALELEDGFRRNAEDVYNKLVEWILN
ncbi:MAG: DUF4364 family protein [Oscillospiraceae bacterium]|nr:DUF4364 family protein [Oscillospiraceae bacterium]